jgi:hypothetical protein
VGVFRNWDMETVRIVCWVSKIVWSDWLGLPIHQVQNQ